MITAEEWKNDVDNVWCCAEFSHLAGVHPSGCASCVILERHLQRHAPLGIVVTRRRCGSGKAGDPGERAQSQ